MGLGQSMGEGRDLKDFCQVWEEGESLIQGDGEGEVESYHIKEADGGWRCD